MIIPQRERLKVRERCVMSPRLSVDTTDSLLYLSCCFMELPLYQHALPVSKAFFFFAWFRKINVYERNTIHHRLKAEVIQEMIAGKIGFSSMYTHTQMERETECVRRI